MAFNMKMKKIIIIVALLITAITQQGFAQDSTKLYQLPQLLDFYYNIKNALVADDAAVAATNAQSFIKAANTIDYETISEGNINILIKDAGKIAGTKDIKTQRTYFANFSGNMATVARSLKLTGKPVYRMYCPMKKAYWLSNDSTIKNPYFGNSMLNCGQVIETFQ